MNRFKKLPTTQLSKVLFLLVTNFIWSQTNTEVYLFDIRSKNGKLELVNPRNISQNEGYDNQPSFLDNTTIVFSSTRNKQTDIALYSLKNEKTTWITDTPVGSEYSPLKIPNKNAISAIRLDTNGLQRLYRYEIKTGKYTQLLKDLKVGYHVWFDDNMLVCSVLVDDGMDLVVSDLKKKTTITVAKNVGRSLHRIPNTAFVSYISKEDTDWSVKSLDPKTGNTNNLLTIGPKHEDMCWLSDGSILISDQREIVRFSPAKDRKRSVLHRFTEKGISSSSRMAVSRDEKHIAVVIDEIQ